jgi:hypothetical protein
MTEADHPSMLGSAQNTRQLLLTSRIGLGLLLAYVVYRGWDLEIETLAAAVICILLAAWPALRWLKLQAYPFPAFETFMLTAITAYAMPLITDHVSVTLYSGSIVLTAIAGVILFQLCALLAFHLVRVQPLVNAFWIEPIFNRDIGSWLPLGLWLNAGYTVIGHFTDWIPYEIDTVLRAIFFGISTSCLFLLGRRWGNDELNHSRKVSVVLAIAIILTFQIATLYLINAISSVLVFFLAYISAGRRIPFVPLACFFVVLTVLHNGKAPMREKYWVVDAKPVALTDFPAYFSEWVEYGLQPISGNNPTLKRRDLLERASLLHMLCLIIDTTERGQPNLEGETYGYVLPMLVPRIFWPEKPSGQITAKRLGIYYRLQDESSTKTTSIGFGLLAEAYANFSMLGLASLGLLIGTLGKVITTWTSQSPLLSNGGLIMILLMAWSLQIELPMSGWVSSFFQASVCVLGVPYVIRRLFN